MVAVRAASTIATGISLALSVPACGNGARGTEQDGPDEVISIRAGGSHTCALFRSGTVRCWGDNGDGQLGDGNSVVNENRPVVVDGVRDAVALALGGVHSCVRLGAGGAMCWGDNLFGSFGSESFGGPHPALVPDLMASDFPSAASKLPDLFAGGGTTCTRSPGGGVDCFGLNLPNPSLDASGLSPVVSMGLLAHSCVALADGTVACWGTNLHGQLGDGTQQSRSRPDRVPGLTDITSVAVGDDHTCALHMDGTVSCWGDNSFGQLGDGTTTGKNAPVLAEVPAKAVEIGAAGDHTCARLSDSTVACWGSNSLGEAGIGAQSSDGVLLPTPVLGLTHAVRIAVGYLHACAQLEGPLSITCWGDNRDRQIGDGTWADERDAPVAVRW